jgi:hypothetical protein
MGKKIVFLVGLPASGKSSFAKELIDKNPEQYKRVNKDDLRSMIDNGKWTTKNEKIVSKIQEMMILEFMQSGYNIIVDNTNLHPKHEKRMREIVNEYNLGLKIGECNNIEGSIYCNGSGYVIHEKGKESEFRQKCFGCKDCREEYELEVKFFDISLSEAIDRDNKRTIGHVGQKVIRGMYNQFIAPLKKVKKLEQDPSLPHCIICDIDGTIAEKGDRDIYDTTKVGLDIPKKEIIDIVRRMSGSVEQIIFFSGRKEAARKDTINWIQKYIWSCDDEKCETCQNQLLFMRKDDDNRDDAIVKKELFDAHIRGKFQVDFILDDRNRVVRMWRDIGLTCLQVAEGDF